MGAGALMVELVIGMMTRLSEGVDDGLATGGGAFEDVTGAPDSAGTETTGDPEKAGNAEEEEAAVWVATGAVEAGLLADGAGAGALPPPR